MAGRPCTFYSFRGPVGFPPQFGLCAGRVIGRRCGCVGLWRLCPRFPSRLPPSVRPAAWLGSREPVGGFERMEGIGRVEVDVFAFVRVFRVSLLAALSLMVVVAAGVPAVATVGSESHCVVRVVGERPDGEFVVTPQVCFETLGEALSYASGGTATFNADLTGKALLADEGGVASVASTFTLGVHFDGFNGTGSSISAVGSDCSGGYWNTGTTWANRISSSWNGCYRLRHYDSPDKAGAGENTYGAGSTHNLSTLNNRTESVAYFGS